MHPTARCRQPAPHPEAPRHRSDAAAPAGAAARAASDIEKKGCAGVEAHAVVQGTASSANHRTKHQGCACTGQSTRAARMHRAEHHGVNRALGVPHEEGSGGRPAVTMKMGCLRGLGVSAAQGRHTHPARAAQGSSFATAWAHFYRSPVSSLSSARALAFWPRVPSHVVRVRILSHRRGCIQAGPSPTPPIRCHSSGP